MHTEIYQQLKKWSNNATRVVIAGIGNPMRNDDFIGTKIVQQLYKKLSNNVYLIECETIPENYLLEIETFNPSHVLLIDAAMLKLTPGETKLIFLEKIKEFPTFTTHALPLQTFNAYLKKFINPEIALLLIQPKNVELGETLTTELRKTADQIETILIELFADL